MQYESEKVEYKATLTSDLYKEVIAFANTDGGVLYIGIDDNGNTIGVKNIDDTYTRVTNSIRDLIQPDVTMFVRYTLQEDNVIRIEVNEGAYKPYYLKSKGLKPSGVFIRQGASSAPASPEQIRQMIKTADRDDFETMRSVEQNLTFHYMEAAFEKYHVDLSADKYYTLELKNLNDNLYTNLAFLLSDQCQHTVKVAVFADTANTIFKDAKEFSGSLFQQLEDTFAYLMLCNRTASSFSGLTRIDKQDYPESALREALLNALIHRDYSFSGSIIINVNESGIEFISLGGLAPGLSTDDIRSGISQPRNHRLAEIFHRLRLIESYGTGIRRIYQLYHNSVIQPVIEATSHTFKFILPNMNESLTSILNEEITPFGNHLKSPTSILITPQMQTVIDYLQEYSSISESGLQELLNIKRTRAYLLARQMKEAGLLDIIGRGANKQYRLKK